MFCRALSAAALLLLPLQSWALSSTGSSVLVVLESKLKREDFSLFFGDLELRGFNLTFREPRDATPAVAEFDVPQFAHVILFAPTTKTLAQDLSSQAIVSLLSADQPVNFLIALSPTSTQLSTLASEFSLNLPPPNTPLISHFPPRKGPHTTIPIAIPERPAYMPKLPPVLTPNLPPILFSGVPHYLNDNPLLVEILRAPAESFASDTETDKGADAAVDAADRGGEGLWAGSQLGVVTGFQARTGARVTWAGGVSLFSDQAANAEVYQGQKSGNEQFVKDVSAWTFQEKLNLRIDHATHYLFSDANKTQRNMYTVNDQVVFTMHLSAWDAGLGEWTHAPRMDDIQLEFTMLDPHIRTALFPVAGRPGEYSVSFRVPDRHGVFKFVVDYRRKGYSPLHHSATVSIVPPRHDEYPRFLSSAWPYYAGALSTSLGFIVFSVVYLGGEVDRKAKGKNKTKKE